MSPTDSTRPRQERKGEFGIADVAAFGVEVAMVVTLAIGGTRVGSNVAIHVTLGILLPTLLVVIWSVWMSPSSAGRLEDPLRLMVQIALILATGALAVTTHMVVWGIVFTVASVAIFTATRMEGAARGSVGG
jgi:hypothetical protein